MIWFIEFKVNNKLGVSDNAIRRHCKKIIYNFLRMVIGKKYITI